MEMDTIYRGRGKNVSQAGNGRKRRRFVDKRKGARPNWELKKEVQCGSVERSGRFATFVMYAYFHRKKIFNNMMK